MDQGKFPESVTRPATEIGPDRCDTIDYRYRGNSGSAELALRRYILVDNGPATASRFAGPNRDRCSFQRAASIAALCPSVFARRLRAIVTTV